MVNTESRKEKYHRHGGRYKTKLENSQILTKQNSKTQTNTTRSTKTMQELNKNRDRHKMHKTRQVLTRLNKTFDMKNKLHVSTYIKTITNGIK